MQCEIIPDMFGKILSPNDTSRKKSGRTDRTAAVRRVTRAFMWSCDWIFLFKTSHNVCHRVAFLLDEASKGRIHREEKKNSEIFFLGKKEDESISMLPSRQDGGLRSAPCWGSFSNFHMRKK